MSLNCTTLRKYAASNQDNGGPVHDFDDATNSFRMLGVPYPDFLNALHTHLTPRTYLEVGTATGSSLALANCDAIAVDPQFQLDVTATGNRRRTFFFQMPSDTSLRPKMYAGWWDGRWTWSFWMACTGSNSCCAI